MSPQTKIIGITGGIATGKSTTTQILRKLGYPVICADEIVHALYEPNSVVHDKVVKLLGTEIPKNNGGLDREKIASLVFANPQILIKLEHIVHPAVREKIAELIKKYTTEKYVLIFVDVPLLFETGMDKTMAAVICVAASQNVQIARLKKHRHMKLADSLARIRSQMSLREKIRKSDHVIYNNRGLSELSKKVKEVVSLLTER